MSVSVGSGLMFCRAGETYEFPLFDGRVSLLCEMDHECRDPFLDKQSLSPFKLRRYTNLEWNFVRFPFVYLPFGLVFSVMGNEFHVDLSSAKLTKDVLSYPTVSNYRRVVLRPAIRLVCGLVQSLSAMSRLAFLKHCPAVAPMCGAVTYERLRLIHEASQRRGFHNLRDKFEVALLDHVAPVICFGSDESVEKVLSGRSDKSVVFELEMLRGNIPTERVLTDEEFGVRVAQELAELRGE